MEIPQEAIDTGMFLVKPDTDIETVFLVQNYNIRMDKRRRRLINVFRLERVMLTLNIVILMFFALIGGSDFLIKPRIEWLEWTALGIYLMGLVVFGWWKKKFIVFTILSVFLILTDIRYFYIIGVNLIFTVIHEIQFSKVKKLEGYPLFRGIRIDKEPVKEENKIEQSESIDGKPASENADAAEEE